MTTAHLEGGDVRPRGCPGRWSRLRRLIRRLRPSLARQYDRSDCGPAALLTVLRHWGGDASLAHVRELAQTDLGGTTLLGLRRAAHLLGFEARGATGSYDDLGRVSLPCIAHVVGEDGLSHYVVVERVSRKKVWIADPARGRRRCAREEFEEAWRSRAVLLTEPTRDLCFSPAPGWIRWISTYFHEERTWLIQSLFLGMAGTAVGLTTAIFVQWLIDRFIPGGNTRMIVATGAVLLALLALRAGAGYLRQRFLLRLNHRISVRVNQDFLRHLFRLPIRFFESRATGDITARIADGVRIQKALLEVVGTVVIDGLLVVGSFVFLFALAPPIGLIALWTLPLYAAMLIRVMSKLRREQKAVAEAYARVEASYIDSFAGISDILGFGVSSWFSRLNAAIYRLFQVRIERLGVIQAGMSLFLELAGGILIVLALVRGALLVVEGELLLGQLMAGYALLAGMLPSIERIVFASSAFQEASVAATRMRDLLLTPTEVSKGSHPFRLRDQLRIRAAVLEWPTGHRLFDGLNLVLPRGRVTGLWGPNGAGKSTLVRVLTRSIPLTTGELLVDGIRAGEFSLEGYRKKVAVLPRGVRLFSGSLARNLVLEREDIDPDAVFARMEGWGFSEFLNRFPARWGTRVGEGGRRLSAGERQVIGLMRALVQKPEVLLVDEGIASTDPEIRELLLEVVVRYGKNRVVLVISHDPIVLGRTDHLCILERGRIEAEGRPADLLERVERVVHVGATPTRRSRKRAIRIPSHGSQP